MEFENNPYDKSKEPEKHRAHEVLSHPDGEEYPGQHDHEKRVLREDDDNYDSRDDLRDRGVFGI